MKNLRFLIQLPSGEKRELPIKGGSEVVSRLVAGSQYVPELVTSLFVEAETLDGKRVLIVIPPRDDFDAVVEVSK
ncbi:MAG: hypothetical protein HY301_01035 [Verrucomicrobia bacterium]|nr:hypothetical protein [Verrucomicrobiota bacterium]